MNRKITTENLKNLKDGEQIETPRGTFKIERFCDQINLYEKSPSKVAQLGTLLLNDSKDG